MPIHHDMLGTVPIDAERSFVAIADEALGASHTLRNAGPALLRQLAVLGGRTPGTTWLDSEGSVSHRGRGAR